MHALKLIPPLLSLAVLAACATTPETPRSDAGAPEPTPGYDWFMHEDQGEALLAYGVANSDEVKLRLDCRLGSGALSILAPGEARTPLIHLESGGDTERYPAEAEPSGLHDGDLLTARARTSDPVFQRFRRLGWIARWADGGREVYAAHPGSAKGVSDFFAACG